MGIIIALATARVALAVIGGITRRHLRTQGR